MLYTVVNDKIGKCVSWFADLSTNFIGQLDHIHQSWSILLIVCRPFYS